MASFKDYREQLSLEAIREIMLEYDAPYLYENDRIITFRTCCHNIEGGSNKLYYYKDSKMFHCYTKCSCNFDIFDLIVKMEGLRGNEISMIDAVKRCGLDVTASYEELSEESITRDHQKIYEYVNTKPFCEVEDLVEVDENYANRFTFDVVGLSSWAAEGISYDTMAYYKVAYDVISNCVIIPHFSHDGKIVGVRGRYFNEDSVAKYKPITYNMKLLNHPTGKTLYGYFQNKEAIERMGTVIVFEGEKSVLKLHTILGDNNMSVAISGSAISQDHISLLHKIGVSNVIVAFDADYRNDDEMRAKIAEYKKRITPLINYFNVSILVDYFGDLDYKDSPIDKGYEVFQKIMKNRMFL